VYANQGKFNEAIVWWKKALAILPDAGLYSNIATAYFYLQRYAESVPMFEKAVAMDPNDEVNIGNLGDAYRWNGQKEKARATYDRAIAVAYRGLQVNPRDAITMCHLAGYYAKKGDRQRSVEWLDRARAINPNSVEVIYEAAIVHTLADQPDEALKDLREAFQKGSSPEQATSEPEFKSLQRRPEFVSLIAEFSGAKK